MDREELVLLNQGIRGAANDAGQGLAGLRAACKHDNVIDTMCRSMVAEEITASYRLCLECGRSELRRNHMVHEDGVWSVSYTYGKLTGLARVVDSGEYRRAMWRLERELGVTDIAYGTL
jgi:hypothetical protein